MPETPRLLLVERPLRPNGYDIDVMGIVSNIVYIRWFEDLRLAFLDTYMPYEDFLDAGISPVIGRTEVDYKRPITMADRPMGRIWLPELGRARWRLHFEISVGDRIHCAGVQQGYFIDLTRKRPVPAPEPLATAFASAQAAAKT